MFNTLILNVDELWLKGKNRKQYFQSMKKHVRSIVANYHEHEWQLKNEQQRFVVDSEVAFSDELLGRLTDLPGLNSVQPVRKTELDVEKAIEVVLADLIKRDDAKTFKVKAKRINKTFSPGSQELNRIFATAILKNTHLKVDVHNPDILLDIKIMNNCIYLSWERIKATGGLPVGTSGHLVTMISGGFDSPVASYVMSKRGCKQTLVFFYAYPYVGEEVKEKILEITKVLSRYQNGIRLYVVPFGEFQNHISSQCKEEYRTLLFRKYMMDVASYIAYKVKAEAILMGDALGQVSSQTIHNMMALDKACKKLVMRPLLGHNKIEIINLAKKVGTHDISILPHDDACALFAPKHPVIKPDFNYWEQFIADNDASELVKKCVAEAEVYKFNVKGEILDK